MPIITETLNDMKKAETSTSCSFTDDIEPDVLHFAPITSETIVEMSQAMDDTPITNQTSESNSKDINLIVDLF